MTTAESVPDGVLPIDKPIGPTSHDVVARARRALRTRRIGHTGTLDPFASGLLLICVGPATRIAEYLSGMDKRYTATIRFGSSTDTDDITGTVLEQHAIDHVTRQQVEAALSTLHGWIEQVPPAYSAKKVSGERAYVAARQGRAVALAPVRIRIDELRLMHFDPPDAVIEVACSTGTYIRSIARDVGARLGTGAHLAALRRTRVGEHTVASALSIEELDDVAAVQRALIEPLDALGPMGRVELAPDDVVHIRHGRSVGMPTGAAYADGAVVVLAADGQLVALAEAAAGRLQPRKVFL